MTARVIYWFRTDLRLHDSPALKAALDLNPKHFYPLWCWDPHYVYEQRVGPNRWQFLLDSMSDVSQSIKKINHKSQLFVVRGHPTTILSSLFKAWGITHIVWEKDDDPYTRERDAQVEKIARDASVEVIVKHGHTLWDADKIIARNGGHPLLSYGPFVKLIEGSMEEPPKPIPAPESLPDPGPTDLNDIRREDHKVDGWRANDVNHELRDGDDVCYDTFSGPNGDFGVPTFEELGMATATSTIRGGETRALEVFEEWMKDKKRVAMFEKPKTNPASFKPASTTQLSPHMKFGTLSCRLFYYRLKEIIGDIKSHSDPPMSLIGQLYWREFFHQAMVGTPNWHQIRGNPVSRFIDWRLSNQYDSSGNLLPRSEWTPEPEAERHFQAWKEGKTGFPWIDAIMRQLRRDGWIHHLARHSVACFLTRGQLYISWERGQEVFDQLLVDWDPAMNGGNWMWLSCSAFFAQYYRVYSPITFGQKNDKHGELIREYVPELKDFPDKYIYSPWTAPKDVQRKAGCIIGKDYPEPIVDEKEAKGDCIERIKAAYATKYHGDHEKVLDGSAQEQLRKGGEPLQGIRKRKFDDTDEAEGEVNGADEAEGVAVEGKVRTQEDGQRALSDYFRSDAQGKEDGAEGGKSAGNRKSKRVKK